MAEDTFSPKEIAVLAGTTAKRMRSFIRACDERGNTIVAPVGSGARYAFTADEARALVEAFNVRSIRSGSPVVRNADTLRALIFGNDVTLDAIDDVEDNV